MADTIVNENSASFHTFTFASSTGGGEAPASLRYDLYDAFDGSTMAGSTLASSSSVTLTVAGTLNAIRHGLRYERRKLVVTSLDGSGNRQVDEFSFLVKNLGMVQSTST